MANSTDKMTNSKALSFVINGGFNIPSDVMEKLVNIKTSIDKKNSTKSDKPSARQVENRKFTDIIYNALDGCEPMTVSQIIAKVPELSGLSTQRVRPMMSDVTKFKNEVVKGKSLYSIVK